MNGLYVTCFVCMQVCLYERTVCDMFCMYAGVFV